METFLEGSVERVIYRDFIVNRRFFIDCSLATEVSAGVHAPRDNTDTLRSLFPRKTRSEVHVCRRPFKAIVILICKKVVSHLLTSVSLRRQGGGGGEEVTEGIQPKWLP